MAQVITPGGEGLGSARTLNIRAFILADWYQQPVRLPSDNHGVLFSTKRHRYGATLSWYPLFSWFHPNHAWLG